MAQERQEEGSAAAWVQQVQSQYSDQLATSASELGLQSSRPGGTIDVASVDAIPSLVALLNTSSTKAQEHAATVLLGLSNSTSDRAATVAAGAVPALVGLLRSESLMTQKMAAVLLSKLADSCDNRAIIISAGAVPLLEDICNSSNPEMQLTAATALCSVAAGCRQLEAVLANRALPILIRHLMPWNSGSNDSASSTLSGSNSRHERRRWARRNIKRTALPGHTVEGCGIIRTVRSGTF